MINLENMATIDPNISLSPYSPVSNSTIEYNRVFRTGVAFPVLLGTGIHCHLSLNYHDEIPF